MFAFRNPKRKGPGKGVNSKSSSFIPLGTSVFAARASMFGSSYTKSSPFAPAAFVKWEGRSETTRSAEVFERRPPERVDSSSLPASENLGPTNRVSHCVTSSLDECRVP
jgi:hypothetical protein